MSCRPKIGGKLREETSGVDRSQAVSAKWGNDPVKEIGQTCESKWGLCESPTVGMKTGSGLARMKEPLAR